MPPEAAGPGEAARRRLSLACIVAALAMVVAGFLYGKANRFDQWIPEGIEYENIKVAAAVSELAHGLKRGRIAYRSVHEELRAGGMTQDPAILGGLGKKFPENISDAQVLNESLARAVKVREPGNPNAIMSGVRPIEHNDLGLVDYYLLSFRLFGLQVESMFSLYYLLHFASVALFIVAYRRRLDAMAMMLAVVTLHVFLLAFVKVGYTPEEAFHVGTPYNQRFVSVLGILGALHLALAVANPARFTWTAGLALAAQVAIVLFVATLRRSALWEVLWGASIVLGFALLVLAWRAGVRRIRGFPPLGDLAALLRRTLSWPAIVFAAVVIAFGAVQGARTDPLYRFSDEFIPEHMFWHSAFVGLTLHPRWNERYAHRYQVNGVIQTGDGLPTVAAEQWLMNRYGIPKDYLLSPVWGLKYRTLERVIREAYVDFVRNNRLFVLQLHLVHKPMAFLQAYVHWHERLFEAWPWWALLAFLAPLGIAAAAFVASGRGENRDEGQGRSIAILFLGAFWAIVPAIVIFPGYQTMSDQVLILDAALLATFAAAAAEWLRSRGRHTRNSPAS